MLMVNSGLKGLNVSSETTRTFCKGFDKFLLNWYIFRYPGRCMNTIWVIGLSNLKNNLGVWITNGRVFIILSTMLIFLCRDNLKRFFHNVISSLFEIAESEVSIRERTLKKSNNHSSIIYDSMFLHWKYSFLN